MVRARKAGFTLVELLVVIGIIALLAGLLLPVLTRGLNDAASAACKNKEGQFCKGLRMYLNQFDQYFPSPWLVDSTNTAGDLGGMTFARFLIEQSAEGSFKPTWAATDPETVAQKFQRNMAFWQDPAVGWTKDYFAPILAFNGPLAGNDLNLTASPPFDQNTQSAAFTKDVPSSQRPLLTECDVSYKSPQKDTSATNTTHQAELTSGWCCATPPSPAGAGVGPALDPSRVFVGAGTSSRTITTGPAATSKPTTPRPASTRATTGRTISSSPTVTSKASRQPTLPGER